MNIAYQKDDRLSSLEQTDTKIVYKILDPERYSELAEVFSAYGTALPNPELSRISVAETEEGKLVGFQVLQLVPHCEPIWIHEQHRDEVEWRKLWEPLNNLREDDPVYAFSESEQIEYMLKWGGFTETGMKVWVKVGE